MSRRLGEAFVPRIHSMSKFESLRPESVRTVTRSAVVRDIALAKRIANSAWRPLTR